MRGHIWAKYTFFLTISAVLWFLRTLPVYAQDGPETASGRKEAMTRAILEAKRRLDGSPRKSLPAGPAPIVETRAVENNGSKESVMEEKKEEVVPVKREQSFLFYFLLVPIPFLMVGYVVLISKLRQERKKTREIQAAKKDLERRLSNTDLLKEQLYKKKVDLEAERSLKQKLNEEIRLLEKQLQEKDLQEQQLAKETEEGQFNLNKELENKERLIKQALDENELLKAEIARINTQLKKEISGRERLEDDWKNKQRELQGILIKEAQPGKEAMQADASFPVVSLVPLGDEEKMLLKVVPFDKEKPYVLGVVRGIGADRMNVELDKELSVSDNLSLSLFEYDSLSPIELVGRLLWQEQQADTAKFAASIAFFPISEEHRLRINRYLD